MNLSRVLTQFGVVVLLLSAWSCANDNDAEDSPTGEKIMWVNSRSVDCTGAGPQKCLQVKMTEDGQWENFYGKIARFEYEEGHFYKLKVRVTELTNPPADGSSLRYELMEVLTRHKDPEQHEYRPRPDLYTMKWRLRSFQEPGGSSTKVDNEIVATLEFDGEGKITGMSGCNDFFGTAEVSGTDLSISDIGTTRKACDDNTMAFEQMYTTMLGNAVRIPAAKSVFLTIVTSDGGQLQYVPAGPKSEG